MWFPLPGMFLFPSYILSDQLCNLDSSFMSQLRFYFLRECLHDTHLHLPEVGAPLKCCHCSKNISPQKHLSLNIARACSCLWFSYQPAISLGARLGFAGLTQSMSIVGFDSLNGILTERLRKRAQEFPLLVLGAWLFLLWYFSFRTLRVLQTQYLKLERKALFIFVFSTTSCI